MLRGLEPARHRLAGSAAAASAGRRQRSRRWAVGAAAMLAAAGADRGWVLDEDAVQFARRQGEFQRCFAGRVLGHGVDELHAVRSRRRTPRPRLERLVGVAPVRVESVRLRRRDRLGRLQNRIGAGLQVERRLARAKPVASSASRASALNTSPHRPQRTWPPAARSTSADSRNTVSHLEHCVNMLVLLSGRGCNTNHRARPPARYQNPTRKPPLPHRPASSAARTAADRRPASQACVSSGASSINGPASMFATTQLRRPQPGGHARVSSIADTRRCGWRSRACASSACGSKSTAITCAAPIFNAAIPRMPEPQP